MFLCFHGRKQAVFVFFALFFAALLIYAPCLRGPFVWDDLSLIVDNANIHRFSVFFTQALYPTPYDFSSIFYYRPLQAFSYYLDHKVWGLNTFGYHLTNVLIHSFNAFMLYCLLSRRLKEGCCAGLYPFMPVLTAFLFLAHPMALTSVAYIAGRADLLVYFFILAALLFLELFVFLGRKVFFAAFLAVFFAALLSKESAVLAPFLFLGYVVFVLKDVKFPYKKTLFALTAGCAVLVLLYFSLRAGLASVSRGFDVPVACISAWAPTLSKMACGYAILFIFPFQPHLGRAIPLEASFLNPLVLLSLFFLAGAAFLFNRCLKKSFSCACFGLAWFFVWIIPLSFFCVLFGGLGRFVIMPENHLYVAGTGLLFILCFLRVRKKLLYGIIGFYLFVFVFMTFRAAGLWRDDVTLYEHLIEVNKSVPSVGLVYKNLGLAYKKRGDYKKAIANYQLALKTGDDAVVYHNLGNIYLELNELQKARLNYLKAISLNPRLGGSYIGLGLVFLRQGDAQKAKEMFVTGLKISPNDDRLRELVMSVLSGAQKYVF